MKKENQQVTPEIAKQWLERNSNRPLRRSWVESLAKAMQRGEWMVGHPDPIAFDMDGRLRNGQHRLNAVVKSGASVWMEVWWQCDEFTCTHLDTMRLARTIADDLRLCADPVVNTFAVSLVRYMTQIREGTVIDRCALTIGQVESAAPKYEPHLEYLAILMKRFRGLGILRKETAAALLEFLMRDAEKAKTFVESYILTDGPVQQARMLRDYTLRMRGIHNTEINSRLYGYAVTACKWFISGKPIECLNRSSTWDSASIN